MKSVEEVWKKYKDDIFDVLEQVQEINEKCTTVDELITLSFIIQSSLEKEYKSIFTNSKVAKKTIPKV